MKFIILLVTFSCYKNTNYKLKGLKEHSKELKNLVEISNKADLEILDEALNSLNMSNKDINMFLHVAVLNNNKFLVSKLLEKGFDIDYQDEFGNTPIMNAINKNFTDIVKILINKKAGLNIKNKSKQNSLDLAVLKDSSEIVKLVMDNIEIESDEEDITNEEDIQKTVSKLDITKKDSQLSKLKSTSKKNLEKSLKGQEKTFPSSTIK